MLNIKKSFLFISSITLLNAAAAPAQPPIQTPAATDLDARKAWDAQYRQEDRLRVLKDLDVVGLLDQTTSSATTEMERMTAENAAAIEDRERLEREKAAQQATKIATEKEKRKTHLDTDVAEDFNFKEANKRQVIAAEEQEAFTGLENKFKKERDLALKRQYEREAATKKFEDETKKRTTALTNASKQRQVIIDEQAADF